MANFGRIGLYFFEEGQYAVTITYAHYVSMFQSFLLLELHRGGFNTHNIWFQEGRATAHTTRASMEVIKEVFPVHVISHRSDLPQLAHLTNLSVCDYFLLGYLMVKGSSLD